MITLPAGSGDDAAAGPLELVERLLGAELLGDEGLDELEDVVDVVDGQADRRGHVEPIG